MSVDSDRLQRVVGARYTVVREVGHGGMAVVFLAVDSKLGRQVAIKVLRSEIAQAIGAERFLREIAIVARLTHPAILPLHDSGAGDGLLYYVMPFATGESLRDRMARERMLPLDQAISIVSDLADALHYAHGEGVVHRDVKPEIASHPAGVYPKPFLVGSLFARAGDLDRAIGWLGRASDAGDVMTGYFGVEPFADEIRADRRFARLLERARVPLRRWP